MFISRNRYFIENYLVRACVCVLVCWCSCVIYALPMIIMTDKTRESERTRTDSIRIFIFIYKENSKNGMYLKQTHDDNKKTKIIKHHRELNFTICNLWMYQVLSPAQWINTADNYSTYIHISICICYEWMENFLIRFWYGISS